MYFFRYAYYEKYYPKENLDICLAISGDQGRDLGVHKISNADLKTLEEIGQEIIECSQKIRAKTGII